MILRKPYAFLIKHFKLIHLIMTLCMGILIYQTNILLEFFNDFLKSSQIIVGTEVANSLFNNYSYILVTAIILISVIVFVLMSFKNKPRLYYVLTILCFSLLIVLYAYSISTINNMQVGLVDERITRAIRDFLNIIFVFQIYAIFISFIRSIGLDVKKFDFNQDVQELNISDKDNEEFEVNVEFDAHTLKRKLRRNYRNLKYYFVENRIVLTIILVIVVLVGGISIAGMLVRNDVSYTTGQVFSPVNYNISILDSYTTKRDYRDNEISNKDEILVAVKLKIKTPNKTSKFIYGKLALQIGDNKYYHTNKYASKLIDIGEIYINQSLTDDYQEFILVYEIPTQLQNKEMTLVYTEQIVKGMFSDKTDTIKIKINPKNLDQVNVDNIVEIGQNYIIGDGLLEGHELKINSLEVNDYFNINYNACVRGNECYSFYEIVKPSLSGRSDKGVLKLNMELRTSIPLKLGVESLITQFAGLEYEIQGIWKKTNINKLVDNAHKDGNYYFEIKKEVLEATSLNLVIKVRNDVYKLKIK